MNRLLVSSLTALAALVAGAAVTAPAPALAGPTAAVPRTADRAPAALPVLHATSGPGAAIVDERGARVLLRGVNVNGLGEYFQANPDLDTTLPLTKDDFHDIAQLGFNSVRLIVSWSRLQPTRGSYDTAYVDDVQQAIDWAAAYGLYVVVDMHQDAYGIAVDTPLDVTCPMGMSPNNGWDGAPEWATLTDGASTCTLAQRELAPAVQHAWDNFYKNTDGVQTQLVQTWGRLARDLAGDANVAGYDLLNEPGFGVGLNAHSTDLGAFYSDTIDVIRKAERRAGGPSRIVFFEPSVLWSATGGAGTSLPKPFTDDTNIVFAPHIYSEALNPTTIAEGFAYAKKAAATYGTTVWSGEWGFFPTDPAEDADAIERYGAAEDQARYGGAWWDWKQACGDPHMTGHPGGSPGPVSPSLVRFTCPDQVAQPVDPAFGDVLSRPVPRAVPGQITKLTSDGRTGAFTLTGKRLRSAGACSLTVWVPARFADEKISTSGITKLRKTRPLGNLVIRGCVSDRFSLRLS